MIWSKTLHWYGTRKFSQVVQNSTDANVDDDPEEDEIWRKWTSKRAFSDKKVMKYKII